MKYKTKSVLIARKKEKDDSYTALVRLFDKNDPHMKKDLPDQFLDFRNIFRVIIKNADVKYVLLGNDIIINDLDEIIITKVDDTLKINCKTSSKKK